MTLLQQVIGKSIKEIQETPVYLVGYYSSGEYYPFNIYQDNETAKAYCDIFARTATHSDGNLIEWTIRKTTVGAGMDLLNKERDEEMKTGKIKEYNYRLRHRVTGQYVSYISVTNWKEPANTPETLDAIEFGDTEDEAEIIGFNYDDGNGENTHYPLTYILSRHEDFYNQFLLDMETVKEDDEKYLFYSEDLDTYFDYMRIDKTLKGATSFRLDSVPSLSVYDLRNSGTDDEETIELFEKNTNFHKVKVSDLD